MLAVPLYLDEREAGMAQLLIADNPQESSVQAAPLIALLKDCLAEDKLLALETTITDGFIKLTDGVKNGVPMVFDEKLLAVTISLPSESKKGQTISARGQFHQSPNRTITPPSPASAYVNFFGSQDYVANDHMPESGRQPARLSSDGAVNLQGVVLEGSANYIEDAKHPFQRGDTRLVYDLPESMVRVAAGDLSYPVEGFQSFQPMLGVTVARDFDLQPYRVSEPTGQTSFFLNSPSRVDIYVNERKVQTLQLDSGPVDVRNFPVVSGSNDVRLVITDANGRVEVKDFSIVSDAQLLESGLHKYAYNLGVISTASEGGKEYDTSEPVLSVFHRYGVNDWLTLGSNLQADNDQQMGGANATIGGKWGILRTDISESWVTNGDSGIALRGQYQYIIPAKSSNDGVFRGARNFMLLSTYRDKDFAPLGVLLPSNLTSYDTTVRYSQQLSPTLNAGIGGRYERGRDDHDDDWSASLTLDKQLPAGIHLGMSLEHQRTETFGVLCNFTWAPQSSRHFVSGSYDSITHTTRTDWNYKQSQRTESFSASAGVANTPDYSEGNGSINYYGNRGNISASHDLITTVDDNGDNRGLEKRTQLRFGTALAMSDGHVAMSRPIAGSFAMIAPDPAIGDYPLGVNPQTGDDNQVHYAAKTDKLGPAVLPELTPYMNHTVSVDTRSLPPGFDPGDTHYTVQPSYHSGTFIKIGSDANVLLDGIFVYKDGRPVALQAGSIHPVSGTNSDSVVFFTNRQGRFRIEKLRPGDYIAELNSFPGVTLTISIPEGSAGATQVGTLMLPIIPDNDLPASGKWQAPQ
jgi:outer membrane usher protein